jgi:hypothetical protein
VEGPVSQQITFSQKRRSTRIYREIPLTVEGTDAFLAPYQDRVSTLTLNCHGCRYQTKHEVIQGDVVLLHLAMTDQGPTSASSRARVRYVQRLANSERPYEVAVELETPGNIWGVASQPEDWFPVPAPRAVDATPRAQDSHPTANLREMQPAGVGPLRLATAEKRDPAAAMAPSFAQLMAGFGEQIQGMAADAIKVASVKEKARLLEEFNAQLEAETKKTLSRAISESKEVLIRRATKDLNDAHEEAARATHERWTSKLQQDFEESTQRMTAYAKEVNARIDNMALSTVERTQRNLEATQRDGMERFLVRLRERLAPVLADVQNGLEKLESSAKIIKDDTDKAYSQFETSMRETTRSSTEEFQQKIGSCLNDLEAKVRADMDGLQQDLQSKAASVVAESTNSLQNLLGSSEKVLQEKFDDLSESTASWADQHLAERSVQMTRQFNEELEDHIREYLNSISKSLSEIPEKAAMRAKG